MLYHKASPRYSKALFELALKNKNLEAVSKDISLIGQVLQTSPRFREFLVQPESAHQTKTSLLTTLFKGHIDPLSCRFLLFLVEKERSGLLPQICELFDKLYQRHKNYLNVIIVSAVTISEKEVHSICERFKSRLNKEIHASLAVDADLLGGFQVHIGDTIYDYSLKNQLDKFKNRVLQGV